MNAHAHNNPHTPLPAGCVRLVEGDRCTVHLEQGGDVIARTAASCMLQPQPTDRVLVTLTPEPHILAVLERGDSARPARIEIAGDAQLHATGQLDVVADKLRLRSRHTELASELLTVVAKSARGSLAVAALVGQQLDVVAERITQKAARVFRTVTEFDQLRARHFDHRADGNARISAQSAVITAREVVKMDGEQVHIG